jgi:hypothetical protein
MVPVALGLAAVALVLILFLVPVVSITVVPTACLQCTDLPMGASASLMYAYHGVGAVYVPNYGTGHSYCIMYGNPGTMCGYAEHRMMTTA